MRYVKTFESFSYLDIDDRLWKQINYDKFEELVATRFSSNEVEELTDSEPDWFIKLLKDNICDPFSIVRFETVKRNSSDFVKSVIRVLMEPKFNSEYTELLLYKFQDEYWVLEFMGKGNAYFPGGSDWTYWVCDTKKGVENCIKVYYEYLTYRF